MRESILMNGLMTFRRDFPLDCIRSHETGLATTKMSNLAFLALSLVSCLTGSVISSICTLLIPQRPRATLSSEADISKGQGLLFSKSMTCH